MSNEIWIKTKEREAFDKLFSFFRNHLSEELQQQAVVLLATYRKRIFDAGVFEAIRSEQQES